MILEVNPQSEIPIYQQIVNQIIIGIAKSELQEGELLPSVRQLADEIGVNMMTVSKAYNLLKADGYIVTDRRNGTKVAGYLPSSKVFETRISVALELILSEAKIHQISQEEINKKIEAIYQTFKN